MERFRHVTVPWGGVWCDDVCEPSLSKNVTKRCLDRREQHKPGSIFRASLHPGQEILFALVKTKRKNRKENQNGRRRRGDAPSRRRDDRLPWTKKLIPRRPAKRF